ncbi:Mn2+dependent serine/threonine protein kinase [Pyrolobus fumarii 1A]|uniref:Mn2+dependent serine/threonine protein kinase n=1 Tax=Pyrolobus fumarii (strain DSM 11204 / 1A) TaxID=694429 RepID=G0EE01_PYRF1|nr:lipopolysaccharide kinase InaA family protein [Pyrolobus fumarii]AEM37917.1 Mn2+dependent serine/threonine protein kinase [Pyrolobus fumarii 1A]
MTHAECVTGDVVAVVKPRGVASVYVVCEGECEAHCPGYNVVRVDELVGDAEASILGELVASMLLTPPEQIDGDPSVIEEARMAYLTRIAVEEHARLRKLLGGLAAHAKVAHIYHIVARASRLSRLYPWVPSSLIDVLRSDARVVVRDAEQSLLEAGCERSGGPWFELCEHSGARIRRGWRLVAVRLTRIWPLVRPGGVDHPLIRDPLLLVKLRRGRLRTKVLEFEEQLYSVTGVKRILRTVQMGLGGTVTAYRGEFKSVIVKRYLTPATAKWVVAAGIALPIYPYRLAPRDRLEAEYDAVNAMLDAGLPVPEPVLVDPRGLKAAYEYIEGTPLHHLVAKDPLHPSLAEAGMLLAQLHREGWVMGDANPTNFIVGRDRIYMVDLEQARKSDSIKHRAWDLAVLVYYSFLFNPQEPGNRAMLVAKAYIAAGGDVEVVREAARVVFAVPFTPIAPVTVLEKARRAFLHVAGAVT